MVPDADHSKILEFDPDRRKINDPDLAQLIKDIISNVRDQERKNRELEERNARLLTALAQVNQREERNARLLATLGQVNQRMDRFERSTSSNPEFTRVVLKTAVQMLTSAEKAINSIQSATKAESALRYEMAAKRALELHKEAISILEDARQATTRRQQESDQKAIEILREAKASIQTMVETLENSGSDQRSKNQPRGGISHPPENIRQSVAESPEARTPVIRIGLTAAPFRNFTTLSAFHRAVQQLPGVVDVKARGFDKGVLHLAIEYSNPTPLAGQLTQLSQFNLRLVSIAEDKIEIVVLD